MPPMRRFISSFVCLFFCLASTLVVHSQENAQWSFYLAFEDATGAQDTLWIIWAEDATFDADPQYGEQAIDLENQENFTVYFHLTNSFPEDKTIYAYPWNIEGMGGYISAINFELPITVSWDSARFNNSSEYPFLNEYDLIGYMDSPYMFWIGGSGGLCNCIEFDLQSNLILEDLSPIPPISTHFPFYWNISRESSLNISDFKELENITIWPNPVTSSIFTIKLNANIEMPDIKAFSSYGKSVPVRCITHNNNETRVSFVKPPLPGIYYIEITSDANITIQKILVQ